MKDIRWGRSLLVVLTNMYPIPFSYSFSYKINGKKMIFILHLIFPTFINLECVCWRIFGFIFVECIITINYWYLHYVYNVVEQVKCILIHELHLLRRCILTYKLHSFSGVQSCSYSVCFYLVSNYNTSTLNIPRWFPAPT